MITAIFDPDGGSLLTLAGADAGAFDQPDGLEMEAAGVVQTEQIVRGTVPVRFHRGNVLVTLSFSTEKSYATWEAANRGNAALAQACAAALGEFTLADDAGTFLTLTSASVRVRCNSKGGAVATRDFTVEGVVA